MDVLVKIDHKEPPMDRRELKVSLDEYRGLDDPNKHDLKVIQQLERFERMFEIIDRKGHVVDLAASIIKADSNKRSTSLPKLLVAPAELTGRTLRCTYSWTGRVTFEIELSRESRGRFRKDKVTKWSRSFTGLTGFHYSAGYDSPESTGKTVVPHVPPRFRSMVQKGDIVAFEPNWTSVREAKMVNNDPALLRPIDDEFYEVVAEWDLTEVEARALGLVR